MWVEHVKLQQQVFTMQSLNSASEKKIPFLILYDAPLKISDTFCVFFLFYVFSVTARGEKTLKGLKGLI